MKWTEFPLLRIGWIERFVWFALRLVARVSRRAPLFDTTLFGFDISKYQGAVNFVKMKAYGAKFLIIRCAYNVTQDQRFAEYMPPAIDNFTALSTYHYYDPVYDPVRQANKVLQVLAPYKQYIRRVWLDLEFSWSGAYSAPANWKLYRDAIKAAGYRVGWYTRATWWDSRVGTYAAEFAKDPVWAAQYSSALTLIPKGWTKAKLWQKGTPAIGIAAGVSSQEIDYNLFNDDFDFAEEWGAVVPPPPPPPEGNDMIFINLVTATALNGRDAPGGAIIWQSGMRQNDIVVADVKDGVWFKVRAVVRAGANVALPVPVVWASAGSTNGFQKQLASFATVPDLGELVITATVPTTMTIKNGDKVWTYSGTASANLTKQA